MIENVAMIAQRDYFCADCHVFVDFLGYRIILFRANKTDYCDECIKEICSYDLAKERYEVFKKSVQKKMQAYLSDSNK